LLQEVTTPHNPHDPLRLIAFNHPLLPPTHGTESLESELEFSYHIGVKHTTFESPQAPNEQKVPIGWAFQDLKDKLFAVAQLRPQGLPRACKLLIREELWNIS